VKVVLATKIHRAAVEYLEKSGLEVAIYTEGRIPPREWFCKELADADALIVTPLHRIDSELLQCAPRLQLIVLHGSGFENIDLRSCEERGVCVARVADPIAYAVAEHALALTLALLRKLVKAHSYIVSRRWDSGPAPRELLTSSLWGKTVGIVGMGRIGSLIAKLFRAFDTRIIYWSRRRKVELELALGIEYRELDDLLQESDIVILAIALTPETRHLVNEERLRKMKRGAIIVNIARGEVIDTRALVRALREGWIAGAALDVFEQEPLPKDHPLIDPENVVLTPHIAGYTYEAMVETGIRVAQTVVNFLLRGKTPKDFLTPTSCQIRRLRG